MGLGSQGELRNLCSHYFSVFPISYFDTDTTVDSEPSIHFQIRNSNSFISLLYKRRIASRLYVNITLFPAAATFLHTLLLVFFFPKEKEGEPKNKNCNSTRKGETSKHLFQFLVQFLENKKKNLQFCE